VSVLPSVIWSIPIENHTVAVLVNDSLSFTHSLGLYRDVPVIPLNLWQTWSRWFRRMSLEVVRQETLASALADAIAAVFEPSALCIDGVQSISSDAPQAIVGGGITADIHNMMMTEADRRLLKDALIKAKVTLKEQHIAISPNIENNMVFAPHFIKSDKTGHVRVAVIRLVALRGERARNFVDASLRANGLLPPEFAVAPSESNGAAIPSDQLWVPVSRARGNAATEA
jgi:hypothetical protein